ncbi:SEL1-like repeat protein [Pseudaminobacter sp. 19-2017]|uniref:SEL1-like repeat protein n=1 Tax=Pseudaminobacter soli (ex Zhang et al. 2022) TaxID=2831468 RepID=A0A942I2P8_9HYPH|nr:peptidoglycan-binding protein [Pseudaminobacter soli]MBS3650027.1 SEL1-like repeat protein [Pseudaminobacter soli]
MNNRRSYLDTLNAGRQRRPSATLEQITQSLQNLESRLDRSRGSLDDFGGRGREGASWDRAQPDRRPATNLASARPQTPPTGRAWEPDRSYHTLARDLDQVRGQEEGVASVSRIAGELKALRDELRQQMTTDIRQEFEELRREVTRIAAAEHVPGIDRGLAAEIERVSRSIQELSERTDEGTMNALRRDIEQVKGELAKLAREETVRSSERHWDEFDRRWTALEDRQKAIDPEISALSERLEMISEAVGNLPESLSLRSLEEKVRMLAGAVDHFLRQQERQAPEIARLIEERLDEISRAIAASSLGAQGPSLDPEPLHRIEARIAALAKQIDEVIEDRPTAEVIERLNALTHRVDQLAAHGSLPEEAIERLSQHVLAVAARIEQTPSEADRRSLLDSIDQRFDMLAALIERRQGDAIERGDMMFRELERRLDEVAERIDLRGSETLDTAQVMQALDAHFGHLAQQLAATPAMDAASPAIRGIEQRLESISARLDESAAKVASIDPDLIRNLESQVAALSEHLSRPAAPLPELEDIGPRLDHLERAIAESRESLLEAARQAAEHAMRDLTGSDVHTSAVSGLGEDLRALENLTRRSDERNARTFEAIHDTLIKIVDRLGTIETGEAALSHPDTQQPDLDPDPLAKRFNASKIDIDSTPPLHSEHVEDSLPSRPQSSAPELPDENPRSPAEAAAEAALAALGSEVVEPRATAPKAKSLLSGLSRVLGRKESSSNSAKVADGEELDGPSPSVAAKAELAPEAGLDEPLDPTIADRPLEPGSGAPDLNAIMKRVREERGQTAKAGPTDAAKADFIAAARRAAQAAAAEAGTSGRGNSRLPGPKRAGVGDIFRKRRKAMLMGATAVLVVLAGAQLVNGFIGDDRVPAPLVADQADQPADTLGVDATGETATDEVVAEAASNARAATPVRQEPAAAEAETPEAAQPAVKTAPAQATTVDANPVAVASAAASVVDSDAQDLAEASDGAAPAAQAAGTAEVHSDSPATASAAAAPAQQPTAHPISIPVEAGPVGLREAAEAGDAKALFEVGARYADGRGVKADMKQAAHWYEKSAELGFAPAQYRIGNLYEKALGIQRDVEKAKTWYQLAAQQGNVSAMHNLAVLYAMGADGTADNESAARWFKRAADLGVKDSQFNLGILAAKGVGMPQNLEDSYKWFALAANAGDRDAAAKRDEIANSLRPEQLERARGQVDLWKSQPIEAEANSVEIPESWQESPGTTASIDMTKAIGNIQNILNKNGYDAGAADGVMGQKTKNAIMAFQKDNQMEPTGGIDEKLVRALLARK